MARYKLILAYDGTAFAGSQRQAKHRTVQGELEKALKGLGWSGRSVILAGRTDTGVHASGQVAAFDLEWKHGLETLLRALNAGLPADVAASGLEMAAEGFHPRFDASSRCYRYRLYCSRARDPLRERFAWRVWPPVETGGLNTLAKVFIGRHDFSAFGSATREESSTHRTVSSSGWSRLASDEWQYEVRADAFLYHMVRRLVFVQVAVGQGRFEKDNLVRALSRPQSRDEVPAGLAPAHGLTLVEVTY
jgi:tRNA pseudouridine38-40 synthase